MNKESVKKEILGLEKKFWQAMKDKDIDTAVKLTSFPCIISGPQGVGRVDQKAFKVMMKSDGYALKDFKFGDTEVELLSNDIAVIAYKVHEKVIVDGKPLTVDVVDSSTWVRKDGEWRCGLHTEAVAGDPFGRKK